MRVYYQRDGLGLIHGQPDAYAVRPDAGPDAARPGRPRHDDGARPRVECTRRRHRHRRARRVAYLQWHSGPTHGPLGVIGLAALTAAIVWAVQRYTDRRGSAPGEAPEAPRSRCSSRVSALGVLCHILMDFPTSYGTRLLSPFNWHWFAADLMPIVDVYLVISPGCRPPVRAGVGSREAPQRGDRARADGGQLRRPRGRAARGHRPRAARVRPAVPQPCDPAHTERPLLARWPRELIDFTALASMPAGPADVSSTWPRCRRSLAVQVAADRAAVERLRTARHRRPRCALRRPPRPAKRRGG